VSTDDGGVLNGPKNIVSSGGVLIMLSNCTCSKS